MWSFGQKLYIYLLNFYTFLGHSQMLSRENTSDQFVLCDFIFYFFNEIKCVPPPNACMKFCLNVQVMQPYCPCCQCCHPFQILSYLPTHLPTCLLPLCLLAFTTCFAI